MTKNISEGLTIKTYNSNWEIFIDDYCIPVDTSSDYINSDVFDSVEDVANEIIEHIENTVRKLTEEEKAEIIWECGMFDYRFNEEDD